MNRNTKVRGAVSVFLVLILVPCLLVSSVFVDLGRVQLSKSMAESAADLALNTLLTNYDGDLNEWYGLVASCQNIEEFYETSAQYFLRTIKSQGLSPEEVVLLCDYYKDFTSDDTIYDLLKADIETTTSTMITETTDANLANPTLMKDQIVEFMKYRGPIEITKGFFGKFVDEKGNPTQGSSDVLDTDKNKPLTDAKQDYYESEGDLLKLSLQIYRDIMAYQKMGITNDFLEDRVQVNYNNMKSNYPYIYNASIRYIYTNLSNSPKLSKYYRPIVGLNDFDAYYRYPSNQIYDKKEVVDEVVTYKISDAQIQTLLDNLSAKIKAFKEAMEKYSEAAKPLVDQGHSFAETANHPVQWWININATLNKGSSSYHTKVLASANTMIDAYVKVKRINDYEFEASGPENWQEQYASLVNEVKTLQSTYLTAGVKNQGDLKNDQYLKTVSAFEWVSETYFKYVDSPYVVYSSVSGEPGSDLNAILHNNISIDGLLTRYSSNINILYDKMQDAIKQLDKHLEPLPMMDKNSFDFLVSYAKELQTNYANWYKKAEAQETQMQKDDYALLSGTGTNAKEQEYLEFAKKVTPEAVNELETRLKNIRAQLQEACNIIDGLQLGDKKIKDIKTYTDLQAVMKAALGDGSQIPLDNEGIDKYSGQKYASQISGKEMALEHLKDVTYNPDVNPEKPNISPDLLEYFHDRFKAVKEEEKQSVEKQEEEQKNTEEKADKKAEDAKNTTPDDSEMGENMTREYSSDKAFSASDLLGSIRGLIGDITGGEFDNIRDDIYVTTYIMEMFSYATYVNEAKFSLAKEKNISINSGNAKDVYKKVDIVGNAQTPKTWLSEDLTDGFNKSLTNKMVNKTNNKAFLGEVEYILYGNTNIKENIKSANGHIYTIRFLLNTVSAFQHHWSNGVITTLASALSGLTGYIIPAPVFKAVLLPIAAAIESANDIHLLSLGFPVELYKGDDDWRVLPGKEAALESFADFFSGLEDNGKDAKEFSGLYYSDYLTIFVYLGLSSGKIESDMYKRMAEVIQSNVGRLVSDGGATYSLKKSRVYFDFNATIRVDPLMMTLPIFTQYEDGLPKTTDWCTYQIKIKRGYT